jgi:hypothetical protein
LVGSDLYEQRLCLLRLLWRLPLENVRYQATHRAESLMTRGTIDDERIESLLRSVVDLGKQVVAMDGHLAGLEAAGWRSESFRRRSDVSEMIPKKH